jgi:hypothetical protein
MSTTPSGSSRMRCVERDSGMKRSAPSRPTTPIGTFMRKIIRQPVPSRSALTSQPARIGPAIAARPITGPKAPYAAPISLGGKTVLIMPKPCGISSAPKPPWRTRKAMSVSGDGPSAQAAEASVKPLMPMTKTRRRPYTSPSRPPRIMNTPKASV